MLLSRIAETMFWLGRYVERAEDMSRVIIAHEQLYLDMPRQASTYKPLIELCGGDVSAVDSGDFSSASKVVSRLVRDSENPASIYRTLHNAKEDLRLSRPLLPNDSWQVLSSTCEMLESLSPLASLADFRRALSQVMEQCQRLTGQIDGGMSRDEAFSFVHIGRLLERADVTLRVIVMPGDILTNRDPARPFANVRWLGTLRYLAADHMFLRRYHARTEPAVAVRFLLFDPWFPRSVYYCLTQIERELEVLPNSVLVLEKCRDCHQRQSVVDAVAQADTYATRGMKLLAEFSSAIEQSYFHNPVDLIDDRDAPPM